MDASRRPLFHGLTLVIGALLVAIGGAQHPMLTGDGASQLVVIARQHSWHTVHWLIAFGYVLVAGGMAGVLSLHANTAGAGAARTGVLLQLFGYAISLVGVLFMLGAGTSLAAAYQTSQPGLTATHAAFLFDMMHPAARAALRVGAFAISLGLCSIGWAAVIGPVFPRWLGWLGIGAGFVGVAAAVLLSETSNYVVAGLAMATVWQLVAGVLMLMRRPALA
jgi:hypothetical protein